MSAPVFDFKITFRPGFQADMDARFAKLQFAFSQKVAATVDPYVPFDTGTLKNSVNQASDFKGGKGLHGENGLRGSYWGQRAIADHKDELEKFAHDAAKQFLGGNK